MQSEKKHERRMFIRQNRSEAVIALCRAAQAGDLTEVKLWLEVHPFFIESTHFSRTPLSWAVDAPNPDVFFYLLSKGADTTPRYPGYTLAEKVALDCRWLPIEKEAALQALAEKGVALNPFLLAAWRGSAEALSQEALLARDILHNNVAHYASASGQVLLLQQLHTIQPQLFAREIPSLQSLGRVHHSLFLWAAMHGYLTAVQWSLREGGAQITERNDFGDTALLGTARHGHLEVVQWLLREGGAQITERNDFGDTALLLAARSKHEDIVNWLISEFGADPGDGMRIAKRLGASGSARTKKARELQALFFAYHLRQQPAVNKRLLQAALPNFPDVLRGMIAEYAQYPQPSEQTPGPPEPILLQNARLLKELRSHATSLNPFLKWRNLSQELIAQLDCQRPCNALTIHDAVNKFLTIHCSKIAGSELATILQNILNETAYFEAANSPAGQPSKEIKFALAASARWWSRITNYFKGLMPSSTAGPKEDKPINTRRLPPQGPLSPPPPASPTPMETAQDSARTTKLIQWLTRLPDPRLRSVNWQQSGEGRATAYFDHEAQAQSIMALLRSQQPELILNLGGQSTSGSPAIRYALSVAAPDGITLVLPAVAANSGAPVSPSALSSASAFFAQNETSSVPPAKREKKTQADAEQTTASTHRDSLHANPLLEEEKELRNSP